MTRPHAAAIVEDAWHRRVDAVLRGRGWKSRLVAHTGYGSEEFVRVLGRVLLSRRPEEAREDAGASAAELRSAEDERRGWRAFITAPAMHVPVTVTVGAKTIKTRSDRSGYIDVKVKGHGLAPGWHEAVLRGDDAEDTVAAVLVIGSDAPLGLISDIDDTVISTSLPRPMIAAWNTFVKSENARHVVPGMATMYREPAGRPPRSADGLPVDGGVEHRADPDPLPAPARLPARPAAAHRLGPDQHGVVPVGAGPQALVPAPAGQRVPVDPVGAHRRRRPARPQDLRRLLRAAARPGAPPSPSAS